MKNVCFKYFCAKMNIIKYFKNYNKVLNFHNLVCI